MSIMANNEIISFRTVDQALVSSLRQSLTGGQAVGMRFDDGTICGNRIRYCVAVAIIPHAGHISVEYEVQVVEVMSGLFAP